jgi:FkbM family methyltransferase
MFADNWAVSFIRSLVERFPRIAAMYRGVRDQIDLMEEPKTTQWGFKLAGNAAMSDGTFEPLETKFIRNILKDVDILVNVGANVGYYCCHALSMGKSVIAFEPIEKNLRHLYKNIESNGWSSVEIYPIALSDSVGIISIYGSNTGASVIKGWAGIPENYVTLVPASTMDTILGSRLKGKRTLIIVDIEGGEKSMLEGATHILANDPKPIWVVEITTKENQPRGIGINPNFASTFQLFFKNGYQAFNFDKYMSPVNMKHIDLCMKGNLRFASYNFLFSESKLV